MIIWLREPHFKVLPHNDDFAVVSSGAFKVAGQLYVVPAGFVTDFATIPRVVRSIIPVNGKHRLPAVVHDYLYTHYVRKGLMGRKEVDLIFYWAMLDAGVRPITARVMYLFVRVFGRSSKKPA